MISVGRRMTRQDRTRRQNRNAAALQAEKAKMMNSSRYFHTNIPVPRIYSGVHPGTDFYAYVNEHWQGPTQIPGHMSTIGASEEIEEEIRTRLWRAIQRCRSPLEKQLQAIADSAERVSLDEIRLTLLPFLQRISALCSKEDVAELLGCYGRFGIDSLLPWSVEVTTGGDLYAAKDKRLTLNIGSLGLPDVNYYKRHGVVEAYAKMILSTCRELTIDSPAEIAIPLESKVSALHFAAIQDSESHRPAAFTVAALARRFPAIPWSAYWKGVGVAPKRLEADSVKWIVAVESCFAHWSTEEWKSILLLHLLLWMLPLAPAPFCNYYFDGLVKPLTGQVEPTPRPIAVYRVLRDAAWRAMTQLFLQEYSDELKRLKDDGTIFIRTLVSAAEQHILSLDWMSGEYKKRTLERLEKMTISCFGSESAAILTLPAETHFLATILSLAEQEAVYSLSRLQRSDPTGYWEEPPYTVNAYYYYSTNQVIVPAANFAWPFFDHRARIGWNYGGLGSIVAHEIAHSFDNPDQEGWTASNSRTVSKRSHALMREFNRIKVFGKRTHGELTLSETMADLAGLRIALDACKHAIQHLPFQKQLAHLREFFISYAVSWRTKEHSSKQLQRLLIDLHAPPRLRVNFIVNHFQEWYDAFNVKQGNRLWIPPSKRLLVL